MQHYNQIKGIIRNESSIKHWIKKSRTSAYILKGIPWLSGLTALLLRTMYDGGPCIDYIVEENKGSTRNRSLLITNQM